MATHGTIATDGAQLYYEVHGDGPPMLIIQGGLSEAGATQQLADKLSDRYQVISYDRRGLSRSTAVDNSAPVTIATHADDAAAILGAVTSQPAFVVGPSIGAVIGLDLAVRYPGRVARLIAHEPPMPSLVQDPDQEAGLDEVAALAYDDVGAAIRRFAALGGHRSESQEPEASPAPPVGDIRANLQWFFDHDFSAVRAATFDVDRLLALPQPPQIIPTGGEESRGHWEYRCAEQLARELGSALVEMPGGHNGFVSHPRAAAALLDRLLTELAP
ncbi:alpha/beta hydrolase [Saccharopolyspora indica]|uniref:alpha/beta fold hydrolase n=1 Tax=Saccharopolyspora indica TaxID=1229659 RepID=UPI0022EA8798|nr:alpha/beta hydrolase [Saccharopolyspora indica]MDA3644403.1 alpha/beta hydrolase [Saccharopolyspora indica]